MQKKWMVFLALCCVLCLLAACGKKETETQPEEKSAAPGYDDRLDALFDSGKAELAKAEIPLPDFSTCEIVMPPDSFWDLFVNRYTEADVRELLKSGFRTATLSPDGKTAVGRVKVMETKTVTVGKRTAEKEVENCFLAVISEGKVTILYPTDQRGRGDLAEYVRQDYMKIVSERPEASANALDFTGFIWSPDGRYFCPLSAIAAQRKMATVSEQAAVRRLGGSAPASEEEEALSTVVAAYAMADIRTGELFALDALSIGVPGNELWLNGFFSEDGQSFYVFAYDRKDSGSQEMEWRVDRFDMNTLEETVYLSGLPVSTSPVPGMTLLKDGRVFGATLSVTRDGIHPPALVRFGAESLMEAATLDSLCDEHLQAQTEYTVGSSKSGRGLALVSYFRQRRVDIPSGLIRVQMDGDFAAEKDTLWVLPSQTRQLEPVTGAQALEANLAWAESAEKGVLGYSGNYLIIYQVKISPDGRYAILLAEDMNGDVTALLTRLSDMKSIPVESPELCSGSDLSHTVTYGRHLLDWTEAGILITTPESSTLYQFQ